MDIPIQLRFLSDQYLQKTREHPEHILSGSDRIALYDAFGVSTRFPLRPVLEYSEKLFLEQLQLSSADKAISWLAIITCHKLVSVWKQFGFKEISSIEDIEILWRDSDFDVTDIENNPLQNPFFILALIKKIIQSELDIKEYWVKLASLIELTIDCFESLFPTRKVESAVFAAYEAKHIVLLGLTILRDVANFDVDNRFGVQGDFATWAVRGYSIIDDIDPEIWADMPMREQKAIPLVFDIRKRLEFWEWWLTEAIPQAWAMVEE